MIRDSNSFSNKRTSTSKSVKYCGQEDEGRTQPDHCHLLAERAQRARLPPFRLQIITKNDTSPDDDVDCVAPYENVWVSLLNLPSVTRIQMPREATKCPILVVLVYPENSYPE